MTRRTALEVSKWVRATPGTNVDRTVISVGTSGPPVRAFTSVPAQNHLPVALEGIKMEGGEGLGIGLTLPNGDSHGRVVVYVPQSIRKCVIV